MARKKRNFLQGETYFIRQEGHCGSVCFFDDACYKVYLTRLISCLSVYQVELHSYVLLAGEIRLLMTPSTPSGISSLMQVVSGAYVQYFNDRFERNGTLWKGRFKSSLIQGDELILNCHKYIELEPARLKLVSNPGTYQWSSYCINGFGGHGNGVTAHQCYDDFGALAVNRFQQYRDFVAEGFSSESHRLLEHQLSTGSAVCVNKPRVKAIRISMKSKGIKRNRKISKGSKSHQNPSPLRGISAQESCQGIVKM